MEKSSKVCVTGGAGYLGSWLVKKLLERGHIVHATLRSLDDPSKVGLLKSLPDEDTRLLLFEADIYNPDEFERAIEGCEFVFHVATPKQHNNQSSQYKDTSEAAVAGVESIVKSCIRSGTVKRLIYTASVMAASPLKEDGTGFKDCMDESCWTPLNLSFPYSNDYTMGYIRSKTLAEKEVLSYNGNGGLEVVTLACGLVGGDTLLPYIPLSVLAIVSQITGSLSNYHNLCLLQEELGSVPLVHIDDVCEAHVFCMENISSVHGRFLCATTYPTITEIRNYYRENYPELGVTEESLEGPGRGIGCCSRKLLDMGFEYKYDMKKILDGSVECARRQGVLN
ncbi:hypothetical protein HHK36_027559 [Tetracentron sinense]|uniref:NAD-dependent epimerase/dehydratase domain-containing protein n=1 Tax=Tetracentron sinense TaxID=13715 RepID=A0A834YF24_TETSI|nr:hypothetical protein HHK36_027559 [Tetracentron sinense]